MHTPPLKITFLGTGTSQGVPVITCDCAVCRSTDPRDKRLRVSVLIESPETAVVIDTGPDFRYQMLRADVRRLDAVLFTHSHKDHTAGMDDVRAYNYFQHRPMDVYATLPTQEVLRREFSYVFDQTDYPGIPRIDFQTIGTEPFRIGDLEFTPVRALHYRMEVLGFRTGGFTYITDANHISPAELEKIRGSRVLVLNALRREPHISHFSLEEAIEIARQTGAARTCFTHISHQMGLHRDVSEELPGGMELAYDTLTIDL